MIYTLTLNPAIDRELTVPSIDFDKVLRATQSRADCGGKGFNVSRMVSQLGGESVAVGFAGGRAGSLLQDMLHERGIETRFVWTAEETRTNVTVVEEHRHIKVNEKGAAVSAENLTELLDVVQELAKPNDWWVLAGSLPPGAPVDIYATLVKLIKDAGAHVILDASRDALREGCKAAPDFIKPNETEAFELTGENDVDSAAAALHALGITNVVISMGADGVLRSTADGKKMIAAPKITEVNPIGAGDALVGGLVWGLAQGFDADEALRWGVACGSMAASLSGTAFGSLEQVTALRETIGE